MDQLAETQDDFNQEFSTLKQNALSSCTDAFDSDRTENLAAVKEKLRQKDETLKMLLNVVRDLQKKQNDADEFENDYDDGVGFEEDIEIYLPIESGNRKNLHKLNEISHQSFVSRKSLSDYNNYNKGPRNGGEALYHSDSQDDEVVE